MSGAAAGRGGPLLRGLLGAALLFEVLNAAYLAAFDTASIAYHVQVVLHVAVGLLLIVLLAAWGRRGLAAWVGRRGDGARGHALSLLTAVAAGVAVLSALVLAWTGTARPYRTLLTAHVGASIAALAGVTGLVALGGNRRRALQAAAVLAAVIALPAGVRLERLIDPPHVALIRNPDLPPLTPDAEGGGEATNPFFPSSVRTVGDRLIPSDFFLQSKACGNRGCHPDTTAQWESSMHHFSSFNNQWYRKSIEYMQEVVGTKPSKWCGGCHDMAILLTGRMDRPIVEQIDTPEAQAGIGCLVCHSIVHVGDTMGQGGYTLEYPEMHRLVASRNPVLHTLHDYMTRLDPGPHRATMLKPFHRQSRAEFCSACHKVHLDRPVNDYRWLRGFNEYDAWQMSGVSGQGARAFYYPDAPKDCGDCHMPLVASHDQGNVDGFVHSHRFPAANTAVPFVNGDEAQLQATRDFLTAGILSVDIFAASREAPAAPVPTPGEGGAAAADEPQTASLIPEPGAGGLAGAGGVPVGSPDRGRPTGGRAAPLMAPLDGAPAFLRPGGSYRFDVVARTRTIGHAFPGGTVDAFDVWLELKAEDASGHVFYWSGWVGDDGRGPVDEGAHRYGSLPIDAHGNPINKRNAWAARAMVYARLIPPGAADVGRFRIDLPRDVRGPVTLTARMNYRKFSWWNTQFSFAGVRDPSMPEFALSPHFDDGPWIFTGDTSNVSGGIKEIPDLPIVVVAEDRIVLPVLEGTTGDVPGPPAPRARDRERHNDYGIGMLLQGDLASARRAFETVTILDAGYADGFVNLARVLVNEGDHDAALPILDQALLIDPDRASGHFFLALALKARGRHDEALEHLRAAAGRFPRDRVVLNQIGRILFLQRHHREAIEAFKKTLAVDPEDLTAHYNLMLCYRALDDADAATVHETLYTRFKADESSQAATGAYRRLHPEDNLERQPIHEHRNRYRGPDARPPRDGTAAPASDAARGGGR